MLQSAMSLARASSRASYSRTLMLSAQNAEATTYVYQSPGSSMTEPHLVSMSDPVLITDPVAYTYTHPQHSARAQAASPRQANLEPQGLSLAQQKLMQMAQEQEREVAGGSCEVEEEAAPTYTYMCPGSSMKEPHYSMSEPVYKIDPRTPTRP